MKPNITQLPQGFTVRPGTMEDIPSAVELFNAYSQHYLGVQESTVSNLKTEWSTPKFNPKTDIRLVHNPENKLVGYIEVGMTSNPPVHPWVRGRVHPAYHGKGIGAYLQSWGEERARQAIPRCSDAVRVAYRSGTDSTIKPAKRLFESAGLKLIRHGFNMLINLDTLPPAPVWPAGITIRTVKDREAEIEAIFCVDNEAFKDHFGYVEEPYQDGLAHFSHWFLNDEEHQDPSLWFLAMDGEKIAAIAICRRRDWENENYGHVSNLAVLRAYRKRGIGLALLRHAFREFYRRGKSGVTLEVDAQNLTGALRLYKRAGMHVHRQHDQYEKELRPGK
ncbi:MAG: GNAT family N-acetyltransferase, partial [Chloroflexota bacterium]|nr:GNAT family N-acetyltransferase [Chloroflexota bacterium]